MKLNKSFGSTVKLMAHVIGGITVIVAIASFGNGGFVLIPVALISWVFIYSLGELLDNQHKQLEIAQEMLMYQRAEIDSDMFKDSK